MIDDRVTTVTDPGLGNTAYLVDLGDGRALAVDASRDLRSLRRSAEQRRLTIAYAADTHLHADFLSGAVQLHATDGASVLASRAGRREFEHRGLEDGEDVDLGGLTLRALATPGHTDEHLSLLLLDGDRQLGVFTGGSLILGSAARTDLVSPERTEELARAQYRSVQRVASLDRDAWMWPTHGGGSFCSASASGTGSPTRIGEERLTNPLLQLGEEEFVRQLVGSFGSFPTYFLRLGEENRRGPSVVSAPPALTPLPPQEVAEAVTHGAVIVDVRQIEPFAEAHPVGSLSIPLRDAFASWLGWLAPVDRPLVVLRDADQDPGEILWQALKIGYENLAGEVAGGIEAWKAADLPVTGVPLLEAEQAAGLRVLDIRQESEFEAGHLPGAYNVELGDVADKLTALDDVPTVVMCGHGERAMGAASLLQGAGFHHVAVLVGGPDDLADARGVELETSA